VLHPGGDFLAHIASLAEIHAIQPLKPRLQQEGAIGDQFNAALRNQMRDAQGIPGRAVDRAVRVGPVGAPAKGGMARVEVTGTAPVGTQITADGKPAGTLLTRAGTQALAYLRFDRATGEMHAQDATVTRMD
jgi:hypothetical protein